MPQTNTQHWIARRRGGFAWVPLSGLGTSCWGYPPQSPRPTSPCVPQMRTVDPGPCQVLLPPPGHLRSGRQTPPHPRKEFAVPRPPISHQEEPEDLSSQQSRKAPKPADSSLCVFRWGEGVWLGQGAGCFWVLGGSLWEGLDPPHSPAMPRKAPGFGAASLPAELQKGSEALEGEQAGSAELPTWCSASLLTTVGWGWGWGQARARLEIKHSRWHTCPRRLSLPGQSLAFMQFWEQSQDHARPREGRGTMLVKGPVVLEA